MSKKLNVLVNMISSAPNTVFVLRRIRAFALWATRFAGSQTQQRYAPAVNKQNLGDRMPGAERYNILCRKLVQEQLYTAASVIVSPRSAANTGEYSELSEMTGLRAFVSELAGHVAAEAARR